MLINPYYATYPGKLLPHSAVANQKHLTYECDSTYVGLIFCLACFTDRVNTMLTDSNSFIMRKWLFFMCSNHDINVRPNAWNHWSSCVSGQYYEEKIIDELVVNQKHLFQHPRKQSYRSGLLGTFSYFYVYYAFIKV